MRLEHHLVGGYVRYISPHIIISIINFSNEKENNLIKPFYDNEFWLRHLFIFSNYYQVTLHMPKSIILL